MIKEFLRNQKNQKWIGGIVIFIFLVSTIIMVGQALQSREKYKSDVLEMRRQIESLKEQARSLEERRLERDKKIENLESQQEEIKKRQEEILRRIREQK